MNSKRPRGKGGNRGGSNGGPRNSLTRSYDSNGPGVRVRGNPHQVHEKYVSLARDAQAEDPILAENMLQHADHYFRIIAEATGSKPRQENSRRDDQSDQDDNRRDDMNDGDDDDRNDYRSDDRNNGRNNDRNSDRNSGRNSNRNSDRNNDRNDDDRGNVAVADDNDSRQPQAEAAPDDSATAEPPAPKRTRRPRRPKTTEGKSEEVASDAA